MNLWFWITLIVILTIFGIWDYMEIKKNDNPVKLINYLFAYRIIEEDDTRAMPTEFLVDWQISNLENHLYLLYLTLEEDLDIGDYLERIWAEYKGLDKVYIDVYRVDGIVDTKHTLIGKFCVIEGRMCYTPV